MQKTNRLPLFTFLSTVLLALSATDVAQAQATADNVAIQLNERIERITHEDKLSRVDELRVGGQTRSIDITPKNGAPAYEITPASGSTDLSEGNTNKSRWRIFSF